MHIFIVINQCLGCIVFVLSISLAIHIIDLTLSDRFRTMSNHF